MKKNYLELTHLIERLHRRYLDVLRTELNRLGVRDINGVQVMLLANVGEEEIVIRDLIERGYYQGSNVSYNIKKLVDLGYMEQERSSHDKRSVSIKLTDKAIEIVNKIRELEDNNANIYGEQQKNPEQSELILDSLRRLERMWSDYIHYGGQ
ncbi:MAG TPA: MarR family transcriptional regulator [Rhodospirillales bacterium]|nr:MarR family transcriptional regulator [Rhodospirillales bacterium]